MYKMDPKDLVIIDYPSLFEPPAPSTPNPSIDSIDPDTDDYFIKLNQAWEEEVKNRNDVIDWLWVLNRVWKAKVGVKSNKSFVKKADIDVDIQPLQPPNKV